MAETAVKLAQKSLVKRHRKILFSAISYKVSKPCRVCNVRKGFLRRKGQHVQNIRGLFSVQRVTMRMKCQEHGINIKKLHSK